MHRLRSALALALATSVAASAAGAHPRLDGVIAQLTERIATSPPDQRLYAERGVAYLNDGRLGDALADFRKAETLGDPDVVAFHLGVLFYQSGEYAPAREALTRALARAPGDPRALDYRARAAREAGDARAALADFEALFASERDVNPGHYLSAAELLAGLDGEGVPQALALLDRGIAQLGMIPQLQRRAIAFELERGEPAAALRRHDALGAALARGPEWRIERAELLLALGREDEAARELAETAAVLASLKPTPARAALTARVEALRGSLRPEPTQPGPS